jgi:hypothetical protein
MAGFSFWAGERRSPLRWWVLFYAGIHKGRPYDGRFRFCPKEKVSPLGQGGGRGGLAEMIL